ncbi:phosphatidylglycerophosphatase A family protein [Paludibaculum fermentans]|uniref:Phosphatidylglycerophosphatase A n=1 Tax=Paludibaculum fermentans TaxID=1473598 RepID=A0A7S7SKQ2_PALFE|nr:phosphatidylglycerophosphatase A [Paludibaculum fermentans]QOY87280.1 phosphatidylglycerophosphatase A [Paludibaculum fermentans]
MNKVALAIATWFGCGFWPKGPGTAGSIGALLVAWPLIAWLPVQPWHFALLAVALTPLGIWASTRTAEIRQLKDPQIVVVDEVLGQWITLAGASTLDLAHVAAALLLFRLFDITKPWPVRKLESLPAGTGIVADDLAAGVYGAAVLVVLRFVVQF